MLKRLKVKRYCCPEKVVSELQGVTYHAYGITQCYLPPDTSEIAPPNQTQPDRLVLD